MKLVLKYFFSGLFSISSGRIGQPTSSQTEGDFSERRRRRKNEKVALTKAKEDALPWGGRERERKHRSQEQEQEEN